MSDVPAVPVPLPQRILCRLARESSLDELSAALGVTDARLLRHLEQLREAGNVLGAGAGPWVRTEAGAALAAAAVPMLPGRAFPARVVADFEQALVDAEQGMFGEEFVQCGGEHRSRLSAAQAEEFSGRPLALVEEYFAPGQGDQVGIRYGFHWVLTPIDLHPLSDGDGGLAEA
jgi:DNA-binding Lrp family transcriptional regulator